MSGGTSQVGRRGGSDLLLLETLIFSLHKFIHKTPSLGPKYDALLVHTTDRTQTMLIQCFFVHIMNSFARWDLVYIHQHDTSHSKGSTPRKNQSDGLVHTLQKYFRRIYQSYMLTACWSVVQ